MGAFDDFEKVNDPAATAAAPPPAPNTPPSIWDDYEKATVAPGPAAPRAAQGIVENVKAGYQGSAVGLMLQRKLPDLFIDPEHSKLWERLIGNVVGGLAPDLLPMVVGGVAGGAAGTAVGGPVGGILGAGMGSFGLIDGLRAGLMEAYRQGEAKTPQDFWNIVREAAAGTAKGAAIGAVTFGAGAAARGVAAAALGSGVEVAGKVATGEASMASRPLALATKGADVAAQVAGMTIMPRVFEEGPFRWPEAREYADGAAVILTLLGGHAAWNKLAERRVQTKLENIYEKTGKTPAEVVADAQADPKVAADLVEVPRGTDGQVAMPTIQEALFKETAKLSALEEAARTKPLDDAERLELGALKERIAALEGMKGASEPVQATEPTFTPGQTADARTRAAERIAELTTKAETGALTDAERAERVFLTNAPAEAIAKHFKIEPAAPSRQAHEDSGQRLYEGILQQMRDLEASRRDAGIPEIGGIDYSETVARLVSKRIMARAYRNGVLPEDLYARDNNMSIRIQDATMAEVAAAEAAIPAGAPTFVPPEVDLFGAPLEAPMVPRHLSENIPVQPLPVAALKLSLDVPQFKKDANDQGVVQPLGGEPDPRGWAVQVWERLNGDLEVISGRHRLDLWRRNGLPEIPAQVHREADGFTKAMAARLDAELNIRDEQGSIADYAQYFKDSGLSQKEADERGLLARAKGRTGFAIARDGTQDLISANRAGVLSDEAALSISTAAPGSDRLQALGMAMVQEGKSALIAVNTMKAVDLMAAERMAKGAQGDIFGFDDSAMREASIMAKRASSMQRKISEQISAVSGASRRPELAKKMGVDVQDPEGIQKRIVELRQEQELWDNWPLHPELVARLRGPEVTGREGDLKQGPVQAPPVVQRNENGHPVVSARDVGLIKPGFWETRDGIDYIEHVMVDPKTGKAAGRVTLGWKGDQAAQLVWINTAGGARGKGLAEASVRAILEHNGPGAELYIGNIVESARGFWEKLGVKIFKTETGEDGVLTLEDYRSARPDQAGNEGERSPAAGDRAGRGSPTEGDAREASRPALTPEEFQLLPETPAELAARNREATEQAQRKLAEEAPGGKRGRALTPEERKAQIDLFAPPQGTLFQSGPAERWYSELGRQIEALPAARVPAAGLDAAQWKALLVEPESKRTVAIRDEKNKPTGKTKEVVTPAKAGLKDVKLDEIKWSGVEEWLDLQEGKVTKEQVSEFLRGNGVKVTERTLGERTLDRETEQSLQGELDALDAENANNSHRINVIDDQVRDALKDLNSTDRANLPWWVKEAYEGNRESARKLAALNIDPEVRKLLKEQSDLYGRAGEISNRSGELRAELRNEDEGTKYFQYQLPGAKEGSYRELLLTLPAKVNTKNLGFKVQTRNNAISEETYPTREAAQAVIDDRYPGGEVIDWAESSTERGANFQSSHFDEPNILAHVRFNERTDAEGKRVLFIEEIQSDWAQKGKKEGFLREPTEIEKEVERLAGKPWRDVSGQDLINAGAQNDVVNRWMEHIRDIPNGMGKIPVAPFVGKTEAWVALSLKRMIRYAAENGMDRVAWTTGEQQVSRYTSALRHAVDAIEWTKTPEGVQLVGYKGEASGGLNRAELARLDFLERHGPRAQTRDAEELRDLRAAKATQAMRRNKVVDTTEKEDALSDAIGKSMADKIKNDPAQSGAIEGENIKIDDTGMASFYDRIVPNIAKDVLKKMGGGKVETLGKVAKPNDIVKHYSDLLQGREAFVPALKAKVDAGVVAALQNDKVRQAVVEALPVDVVNVLSEHGITAEQFTRDPKMFIAKLPVDSRLTVANGLGDALASTGASLRAGLDSAHKGGFDRDVLPAVSASDIDTNVAARILFPESGGVGDGRGGADVDMGAGRTGAGAEPGAGAVALGGREGGPAGLAEFVEWHKGMVAQRGGDVELAGNQFFSITPEMRDKALEGLPLFQKERASYQIAEKLITTMQGADKSSVVHELGHDWLEEMKADASRPDAPESLKADWEILRKELAIGTDGTIERASHEQFARSVERYLAEGEAPSVELRSVFQRFKEWLLAIYHDLTNLNVQINPELKAVLDRMLATDQEIADAQALNVPRAYVAEARATEAAKIVQPQREIKPGFEAEQASMEPYADELPAGPGEAPDKSHVNYGYMNAEMDVKLAAQRMAEIDQANIQAHRGGGAKVGVKSWDEANAEQMSEIAGMLNAEPAQLQSFLNRYLGPAPEGGPDKRLGILKKLAVGAAKDSARLRDVVLQAGADATVRQQLEYMGSIERARMIQATFLGERASVARALNALKDTSEGSGEIGRMLDVIGYGEEAANTLHQEGRTPAEENALLKAKLDEILLNYKGKTVLDIAKLHKEIGTLKGTFKLAKDLEKATTWEQIIEGWRSGLLSGPVTHTTNLFGTGAFQVLRPAVDALASVIGMARGASPGMGESDRASMSEAISGLTAYLGAAAEGARVGYHTFKLDDPTGKTEAYRTAIPGRAGELIRVPLRMMGAEDAMVTTMYRRKELAQLAIRQAFDEDLNPGSREFAERVDHLKDLPTPEMQAAADSAATRMTFNEKLGEKGVYLQLFVNKWNLQWMIPFIRTPINITKELARMSPFAPMVGEWRADIAKGGVARDRALAEIALGSGIMALTMAYTFSGQISGSGSPDPGKNRGKAGVWQPNSILVNDTWYEYSRIQPTGTLMGLSADLAEAWDHMTDEEKDKVPKMLARAFANAVTNQTFLQGITNVINAMSDPARFGPSFLKQMAGSMVPNVIGQPTTMADPVVREVNGMLDAIQARIPGLRQDLLPKRDWLGEEVKTKERLAVVGPVREQPVSEDKVRQEAARLEISMAEPPKKTHIGKGTGKMGDVELTPEERNLFAKASGETAHKILTSIVNQPGYDAMPDLIKRRVFQKVLTAAHRVGAVTALPPDKRASYLQEITEKVAVELAPTE